MVDVRPAWVRARDQLRLGPQRGFRRRWTAVLRWFVATGGRRSAVAERESALKARTLIGSIFYVKFARDGHYERSRD